MTVLVKPPPKFIEPLYTAIVILLSSSKILFFLDFQLPSTVSQFTEQVYSTKCSNAFPCAKEFIFCNSVFPAVNRKMVINI